MDPMRSERVMVPININTNTLTCYNIPDMIAYAHTHTQYMLLYLCGGKEHLIGGVRGRHAGVMVSPLTNKHAHISCYFAT